ncbi:MAG: hypothetical protein LBF77_10840 [Spirochaetaceae bacterium]|jgi:hypothetical protein|nr:hypothetical protein [Spirochaetaceae bacterium]
MYPFLALFLASSFLCASCAGHTNILQKPLVPARDRQIGELSDFSFEEVYDSGYWVTRPRGGAMTILGIAGRRGTREEAVREALSDAARKAALYHGVYGESAAVLNQGSGNLDYFSDFDYRLDLLTDSEGYIGELIFDKDKDILEKEGSVMVRVQYSGIFDIPAYETGLEDGIPGWVNNYTASVPGFLAAVGYSKNRGSLQKTCQASYENAIVSLLPRLSSKVANEVLDAAGGKITRNVAANSGVLENVMILETWFDRKANALWTLVAAREKTP